MFNLLTIFNKITVYLVLFLISYYCYSLTAKVEALQSLNQSLLSQQIKQVQLLQQLQNAQEATTKLTADFKRKLSKVNSNCINSPLSVEEITLLEEFIKKLDK